MASGRIGFSLGSVSFEGEGEADWVVKQMESFVSKLPALTQSRKAGTFTDGVNKGSVEHDSSVTLASFLRSTGSTDNQVRKFLATAEWLHQRGETRVNTSTVVKALRDSSQKSLGNASDCLNRNVSKGFCEKVGSGFFVTDEGRASLGGLS